MWQFQLGKHLRLEESPEKAYTLSEIMQQPKPIQSKNGLGTSHPRFNPKKVSTVLANHLDVARIKQISPKMYLFPKLLANPPWFANSGRGGSLWTSGQHYPVMVSQMKIGARDYFMSREVKIPGTLPEPGVIGGPSEIEDMIRIWKVLGPVISVGEEQIVTLIDKDARLSSGCNDLARGCGQLGDFPFP
jgi:hypothetical protein